MIDISFNLLEQVIFYITIFLILGLGFWVFSNDRKRKINQLFFLMTISIGLWISFAYFSQVSIQYSVSLLLIKLAYGAGSVFLIIYYFFVIHFPREEKKCQVFDKIIFSILLASCFIFIFTDLIVRDIKFEEWGVDIIYGNGAIFFNGAVIFISLFSIFRLLKRYFKFSRQEKLKVQYFLIGFFIFSVLNIVFNVINPLLRGSIQYYQFGNYSVIFLIFFTAYAIVKHELMGIKTLITQVLIVIISLILFLDIVLLSDNVTMQLLKAGVLLIFLYFSRGMVESVRNEKKAREELEETYKKINTYIERLKKTNVNLKEKNEDLGVLLKISDVATGTLNSRKIAQNIVNSIPINLKHLKYKGGILILYDRKKEIVYSYALTESELVKKAKKLLSKSLTEHTENINEDDNLVIETVKTKEMQIGDKLEDFLFPAVNKKICKLIQKIVRARSFVSIPMFSGGRVIGVVVFVGTKPKSEITQRDKDILFGFSSHIGATIENAQLYEQTEKQIKTLSILNENLKMANVKLKELMEMKNEFLHITSHQLRTPLTTIRGMISMWHNGDFNNLPEKERKKMLKRIYISSERLNNITNDMLDSLELEGGFMKFQFKQAFLKEIIKETVDIMRPNFDEKNLYIKFNDSVNVPKVEVEPNYIRQVFINTIDNACKYTKKGGVDIDIKKAGDYVEITIKDTGIGVSKRDQKKIFLKFTRGKRASIENASGSGLGLFIAKKIINAHNGKIKFFSEGAGKGSIVKVLLPIKQK